jgi:hypothetical protein
MTIAHLAPARGIINAVLLSAAFWIAVAYAVLAHY